MNQQTIDALKACEIILDENVGMVEDERLNREFEALRLVRAALNPMPYIPTFAINIAFSAHNAIQYALAADGQDASLVKHQLENALDRLWTIAQLHPQANL